MAPDCVALMMTGAPIPSGVFRLMLTLACFGVFLDRLSATTLGFGMLDRLEERVTGKFERLLRLTVFSLRKAERTLSFVDPILEGIAPGADWKRLTPDVDLDVLVKATVEVNRETPGEYEKLRDTASDGCEVGRFADNDSAGLDACVLVVPLA